jgi:radical SAM superfamily enzyme YgiQ (UPF0313 family)
MMRCKIILYNPRAVFYTMPLALIAIGSALDPSCYDVRIIDGRLEADPARAILAEANDAVCLGVTVLTGAPLRDALHVSRAVKAQQPDLPIVWGGWHPSLFPDQCLGEASVDAVVIGQGEETFAEMVERFASGRGLDGVFGCSYRVATSKSQISNPNHQLRMTNSQLPITNILHNPPRPLRDINDLPAHNYNLIDVERYFKLKGKRQFDYISSQGCRFRCTFCADPYVYKRGWYGLAPERMVRELSAVHATHPFEEISFQDETFFTSAKRVEEVSDAFIAANLRASLPMPNDQLPMTNDQSPIVQWTATMRADQGNRLDDEVLTKARRAGLRRVMIGVEAGSDEMLRRIKKDITITQVMDSAEKCRRHGIGIIFNLIVGFPHEPEDSVDASLEIAKQLRAMSADFEAAIFFYRPYPGNAIADELLRDGYRFPQTLAEWADFDYIAGRSEWVSQAVWDKVERFKFYQKYAFHGQSHPLRWPLYAISKWRVQNDFYAWPIEKTAVEWVRRPQRLS